MDNLGRGGVFQEFGNGSGSKWSNRNEIISKGRRRDESVWCLKERMEGEEC